MTWQNSQISMTNKMTRCLKAAAIIPVAIIATLLISAALTLSAGSVSAQVRQREPNSEYAARRARLRAQVDAPVVLFGYTGRENASDAYVFNQENNFYYLTGDNEEGAALLLVPDSGAAKGWTGPTEILYLHPRNHMLEQWNGPRMGPDDPGIREKTGFDVGRGEKLRIDGLHRGGETSDVRSFDKLAADLAALAKSFPTLYTILAPSTAAGYPHFQNWQAWLAKTVPDAKLVQVSDKIGAMRQIKSAGELAMLTRAIEASVDAQLAAFKMMRPGLYEYQVAARMQEIHFAAGCEMEAYAPIVGAGFNSTVLHYDKIGARIENGDIVVMDAGGQYSGYTADITRTIPANGKFTARQREIYDVVYGAQQAALAALKPGMRLTGGGSDSLVQIARYYMNTHGKGLHGESLDHYFIHGLGHHIGLDVHDAGDPGRVLEPGMVVTIEPGIYIPEEKLGVRIEDDVLITATGYKLLTERLPRSADEIEKLMAGSKSGGAATQSFQEWAQECAESICAPTTLGYDPAAIVEETGEGLLR
jgi:Xaa-Pro aminopeptidase